MSKHYKKPPILEAVCEFKFDQNSPWDTTIPGLLFEGIKKDFPKKKNLQMGKFEMHVDRKKEEFNQQFFTRNRAQFLHKDEKIFVLLDENLLTINHLKPYTSWKNYFSNIQKVFETYKKIANPKQIERIGVRYINRIEVPQLGSDPSELKKYFNFRPFIGEKLPQKLESVIVGSVFVFENKRDRAKLQLLSESDEKNKSKFIIDIDYFLNNPNSIELKSVSDWVQTAHNHIGELFEEAITDEVRGLFE